MVEVMRVLVTNSQILGLSLKSRTLTNILENMIWVDRVGKQWTLLVIKQDIKELFGLNPKNTHLSKDFPKILLLASIVNLILVRHHLQRLEYMMVLLRS